MNLNRYENDEKNAKLPEYPCKELIEIVHEITKKCGSRLLCNVLRVEGFKWADYADILKNCVQANKTHIPQIVNSYSNDDLFGKLVANFTKIKSFAELDVKKILLGKWVKRDIQADEAMNFIKIAGNKFIMEMASPPPELAKILVQVRKMRGMGI